jgi:hypothetical protein
MVRRPLGELAIRYTAMHIMDAVLRVEVGHRAVGNIVETMGMHRHPIEFKRRFLFARVLLRC